MAWPESTPPMGVGTLMVDGEQYAVIPWEEYQRMVGEKRPRSHDRLRRAVCAARAEAGLTQMELAKRLRTTQATVSRAEAGHIRVTDGYLQDVLRACKRRVAA